MSVGIGRPLNSITQAHAAVPMPAVDKELGRIDDGIATP